MVLKVENFIKSRKKANFRGVFEGSKSKPELVATFLAILVMIRESKIVAEYDEDLGDFILTGK